MTNNQLSIGPDSIQLRDFALGDVDAYLDYWYSEDTAHLRAMGVEPDDLPSRKAMRQVLCLKAAEHANGAPSSIVGISMGGKLLGVHELTDFRGIEHAAKERSAIMHAHIWNSEFRGRGIGLVSYFKALRLFFGRFGLDEVRFETPADKVAANAVKNRLGIVSVGKGYYSFPLARHPLETFQYRVFPQQMPDIERRMRSAFAVKAKQAGLNRGSCSGTS